MVVRIGISVGNSGSKALTLFPLVDYYCLSFFCSFSSSGRAAGSIAIPADDYFLSILSSGDRRAGCVWWSRLLVAILTVEFNES